MPLRRPRTRTAAPSIPAHAAAIARSLARRAADGRRVAPAIFATDPRERYVCVYAERAGGLRMVVHVADRAGRQEWRAPVDASGAIGAWVRTPEATSRVADLEHAFELALAS